MNRTLSSTILALGLLAPAAAFAAPPAQTSAAPSAGPVVLSATQLDEVKGGGGLIKVKTGVKVKTGDVASDNEVNAVNCSVIAACGTGAQDNDDD